MFIYLIVNHVTGKYYVGQHKGNNLKKYLQQKFYAAWHDLKSGSYLYASIRKYGRGAFSIHALLSDVQTKIELDQYERDFISFLRSREPDYGYNITGGGEDRSGIHTENWYKKMRAPSFRKAQSEKMKCVMNTPQVKINVSIAQQKRFSDPAQLEHFSAIHCSLKTRKRHSDAAKKWQKENPQKHTEDWKKEQSKRSMLWHSEASLEEKRARGLKISESKKGKGHPQVERTCPVCLILFEVSYGERNQMCCSKGCATRGRYRKSIS